MTRTRVKPGQAVQVPWWVRGDANAFFGLGLGVLVNVLVLTSLVLAVVHFSRSDVFGVVLPALGVELVIGNVYYAYLARRLSRRENRTDVTAMPYGPSVPHMFIVTFVIMLPVYLRTKDPFQAWAAGLAWAFIIGVIVLIGAFIGPTIRRFTPRAALLGTLAGISITFISMRPAAQMWEAAWIALPAFTIILVGFFGNVRLPGNFPVGLAAVLLGTAIAWIGGYMSVPDVGAAAQDIALSLPTLRVDLLIDGLRNVAPLLATAIPLGVYNFTEGMSNVESAAAAGDNYNLRSVLLADGTGAIVGSALGSPFPPAVYIGHPGWKSAGGRAGYSMLTGIVIAILCFLGMFGVLGAILPLPAIVPFLLYIGLLIGAQAFQAVPSIHAPAVVAALIPNIASWAQGLVANALSAAGTTPEQVSESNLVAAGVIYRGLLILGSGAILAGLVLGAIVTFIIDRRFLSASIFALVGAVLSFVGLIHAEKVQWVANGQVALGYLFVGLVCLAFAATHPAPRDAEEIPRATGQSHPAGQENALGSAQPDRIPRQAATPTQERGEPAAQADGPARTD